MLSWQLQRSLLVLVIYIFFFKLQNHLNLLKIKSDVNSKTNNQNIASESARHVDIDIIKLLINNRDFENPLSIHWGPF